MKHFTPLQTTILEQLADGKCHSGALLAKQCQLSRTAIWKHIGQLQNWGLSIVSIPRQGYRWEHPVQLLDKKKILAHTAKHNYQLHVFTEIESTNRFLKEYPPSQQLIFCCAEKQTQGRGRFGRNWISPFGDNIYLSGRWFWGACMSKLSGLSLVVSLAILAALRKNNIDTDIRIKWPNDLIWNHKKLAGILIEVQAESNGDSQVTIGIGLNVNSLAETLASVDRPCCSLREITGQMFDRNLLIADLIDSLDLMLTIFAEHTFEAFANEWKRYDYLAGKRITISLPTQQLVGQACGVNMLGQLVFENDEGEMRVLSSGECSIGEFVPS